MGLRSNRGEERRVRTRWSGGRKAGRIGRTPYAGLNRVRLRALSFVALRRDPAAAFRAEAGQVPRVCLNPNRDTPGGLPELYLPRTIDNVHMRMFLLSSF